MPIDQVAYAIIGLLAALGVAVGVLAKADVLKFGKKPPKCPYPCGEHGALTTKLKDVEEDVTVLKSKMYQVANDVSFIRGWLTKNGRAGGARNYDPPS